MIFPLDQHFPSIFHIFVASIPIWSPWTSQGFDAADLTEVKDLAMRMRLELPPGANSLQDLGHNHG